ncbi:MAG: hypothetical protein RJA89_938, partial [Pseudomonadota bacterium]
AHAFLKLDLVACHDESPYVSTIYTVFKYSIAGLSKGGN